MIRLLFVILGGFIGFVVHYVRMHAATDTSLFSIGPHAVEGILLSLIGALIGFCLSAVFYSK